MGAAIAAGLVYGVVIFGVGFTLGALRELALAPLIGRDTVILIEIPLILLMAWVSAGWLTRRLHVHPAATSRFVMGLIGFMVVIAGETAVSVFAFDRTLAATLAGYATRHGLLEILPQIMVAVFPFLRSIFERTA